MTCEVPSGIVISIFQMTKNQERCLLFHTYQWCWTINKHWFSGRFYRVFMLLEDPSAELFPRNAFGCHFRSSWFSKGTLWASFSRSRPSNTYDPELCLRPFRDPVFHETIVITVPFRPSAFSKGTCSIKICSSSIFTDFLCAELYIQFVL